MSRLSIAALALSVLAGSAQAAFVSAFSDQNHDGPTFSAMANQPGILRDGRPFDGNNIINYGLAFDLNEDAPGGQAAVNTNFEFIGDFTNYQVTPFNGNFIHSWAVSGSFRFLDAANGGLIFQVNFTNALMTSWSSFPNAIWQTATLQGNLQTDPELNGFVAAPFNAGGNVIESWSFSMSALRNPIGGGPIPVTQNGSFASDLISEGSFSARYVPTPGAAALLGLGGLVAARRRRVA